MATTYPWLSSYEQGVPATVEVPNHPLHQFLIDSSRKYPNKTAVRMVLRYLPLGLAVQARLTYRELDDLSDRFAAALAAQGIQKGSRVSIMLPNCPQQVVMYFGVLKAGGIVVNTNPTYPPHELEPLMKNSGAEAIVTLSGLYQRVKQIQPNTNLKTIILTDLSDHVTALFRRTVNKQLAAKGMYAEVPSGGGVFYYKDLIGRYPARAPSVQFDTANDTAVFQFTGGTTGIPKAAELTHRNLVANTVQMQAWFTDVSPGNEKVLLALPAFHVYGMTVGMLFGVSVGAEIVVVPDPRDTNHILEILHREHITLYPGVPAMYIAIINHPRVTEYNLRSIKACLSGGSALPVEVAQKFDEITGGRLVEGFGMSESSPVTHANPIKGRVKYGSIGIPIPSTEAAIVSLEPDESGHYKFFGIGEEGELVVRGPQVMKGYYNNPEETAKTIDADGWLHTGDIARMDEDGYFYIVDRKKDLIIASGYNVVPREVEEVLFMHPKVMEAAVVGVPDPKRGETVKAFVVLKEGQTATAEEIREFCKEHLAPYKVPTLVEFRKELPKTQVGKVLRRMLVEEEKAKLAAAAKEQQK
ncbi:long-chain-fatty-acid--CoA ligase [Caldilinea sp.]|jgi:long-chain acyl-CoA synthetase|uniref:long-chain-fatty-acid--CoA ligase n=1 Tax=Caldilinea sp. TaxID=2293560 RepID=UPI002619554B|nr:long-chain fatty acid--CoA ligase [uncultured Caldilinea sp.]